MTHPFLLDSQIIVPVILSGGWDVLRYNPAADRGSLLRRPIVLDIIHLVLLLAALQLMKLGKVDSNKQEITMLRSALP